MEYEALILRLIKLKSTISAKINSRKLIPIFESLWF